ncbi:MAG: hypothetical protein J3K34DRAFT_292421 [Monoraphidium minutum]|nr:MAG: hypothetical protein J3K34DRAFT_292421 [Monoraphidium minutum]
MHPRAHSCAVPHPPHCPGFRQPPPFHTRPRALCGCGAAALPRLALDACGTRPQILPLATDSAPPLRLHHTAGARRLCAGVRIQSHGATARSPHALRGRTQARRAAPQPAAPPARRQGRARLRPSPGGGRAKAARQTREAMRAERSASGPIVQTVSTRRGVML